MTNEEPLAAAWSDEAVQLLHSADATSILDRAVGLLREAVIATPPGHPELPRYLANLGGALQIRFKHMGDRADLDEAIAVDRAAVDATQLDHPYRSSHLSNLAGALLTRF